MEEELFIEFDKRKYTFEGSCVREPSREEIDRISKECGYFTNTTDIYFDELTKFWRCYGIIVSELGENY